MTEGELKSWIKHAQKKYIYDNVENQWQEFDGIKTASDPWTEYRTLTYGTYLGKGQGVSSGGDHGLESKKQMGRAVMKGRNHTYLRWFDAVPFLHLLIFEFVLCIFKNLFYFAFLRSDIFYIF